MSAEHCKDAARAKWTIASLCVLLLLALSVALTPALASAEPASLDLAPSFERGLADAPSFLQPDSLTQKESDRIPGQYIVVLKDSVDSPLAVAKAQANNHDGQLGPVYSHAIKGYAATLSKQAVEDLRQNPKVAYISPNRRFHLDSQTIPTGIARSGATENATAAIDGNDTRVDADVAVIDTGVDQNHPDLDVYKRTNCVAPHENPEYEEPIRPCLDGVGTDGRGHGTHVAGTIGAFDNGEGVVGVAPGTRIWSVRVFNNTGGSNSAWVIAGVDWVKSHAAEIEVANMSLGGGIDPALEEAISATVSAGVVFAVAAGNDAADANKYSPAKNPDVITVSALADYDGKAGGEAVPLSLSDCQTADEDGELNGGSDDTLAWFSNWGSAVDVAAPGVCVLSTVPGGGYDYNTGTSMAAPHVAGAAALLASKSNPNDKAGVEAIRKQIIDEGSQDWADNPTAGDQKAGQEEGYTGIGEGEYDSVQEPLLDLRPQAAATYTTKATNRKFTSATLNGGINPNGTTTSYQFEWGPTTSYGTKVPASPKSVGSGTKDVEASEPLSGLKTNATYHYRIVSSGSKGTVYGKDKVFTAAFKFLTYPPHEIEASSARLEARINPNGTETSYQFEYGTTTSYGSKIPAAPKAIGSGSAFVSTSQLVEGLKPSTTYHYRVAVTNKDGTFYGSDKSFATPAAVVAKGATGLDARRARLEARVNPTGLATTYQFEWGTSKQYGNLVPASPKSIGSGAKRLRVNELIEGLKPDSDYHFRVKATNSVGTVYGADTTFSTATTEFESAKSPSKVMGEECGAGEGGCGGTCAYCSSLTLRTLWGASNDPALGQYALTECGVPLTEAPMGGVRDESLAFMAASVQCKEGEGLGKAQLEPKGCRFELHPGREATPGEFRGSTDIGGPECTGMVMTFSKGEPEPFCKITIDPQNGLYTTYKETTGVNGKKRVLTTVNGKLTYTQEGNFCPDGTFGEQPDEEGAILVVWELAAYEPNFTPLDLRLKKANGTATTKDATALSTSEATLNGAVNPGGLATTYQFQYVSAAQYNEEAADPYAAGAKSPTSPANAGSGNEDVPVSTTLKGLGTHKTYHYRVITQNSQGTTYGKDKVLTTTPELLGSFGAKGSGNGQLSAPKGLAVDASGNLYVADSANNRIEKFNAKGEYLSQFGALGSGNGQLKEPSDIAIDSTGDLWVLDKGNFRVQRFSASGQYLSQFGSYGEGESQLKDPTDIAVDSEDDVWVLNGQFRMEFDPSGDLIHVNQGFDGSGPPTGMAIDQDGAFWVGDLGGNRLEKLGANAWEFHFLVGKDVNNKNGDGDPDICVSFCASGTKGSTYNRQFDGLRSIEVLPSNNVVVTDAVRAQEITADGKFVTSFGAGQLSSPAGVAAGPGGAVYIADTGNNRIQRWCMPKPPAAITQAAASVSGGKATLQGAVNPSCLATTYQFEYGTTASYGSKIPASPQSVGSGVEDVAVSQAIEGLSPQQTYHYRVVATNADGTTYGADREFFTGSWATQTTPNPTAYDYSYLEDTSCLSATFCVAVGNDSYRGDAFIQTWDGTEWKTFYTRAGASMNGISCSGSVCLITGQSPDFKGLTWKMTKGAKFWSIEQLTTPTPEGVSEIYLKDVSCSAETACTAVGHYTSPTYPYVFMPLAMRWNGTSWTIQTTPNPSGGEGTDGRFFAVSCPTSTSCTAVGTRSSSGLQTFSERWNGTSWSIVSVPKPAGSTEGELEDVSCATASACMGVGWYMEGANPRKGLSVSWNGSAWSVVATAVPSGAENGVTLNGVSCTAANACTAVGRTGGVALLKAESTIAEVWNGSSWAVQTTVNPLAYSRLSAVSCTATNACTAVGKKRPNSSVAGTLTLAERWG
jgi:subtilisin family serine protease/sugar lactone lactonase YvrE